MRKLISSCLAITVFGMVMAFVFLNDLEPLMKPVQAQTQPTATPCGNPTKVSNRVDPCHPPKTISPEEITARLVQWEIKKKKLFSANFPLENETSIDVEGDGKNDKVLYQIKPWEKDFEGLLKITSANGKILWEHEFFYEFKRLGKFFGRSFRL